MAPALPGNLSSVITLALGIATLVMLVRWLRSWPLQDGARKAFGMFVAGGLAMAGWIVYALLAEEWGLGLTVFAVSLGVTPLVFTAGVIAFILRRTRTRPEGPLLMSIALLAAVLTYLLD